MSNQKGPQREATFHDVSKILKSTPHVLKSFHKALKYKQKYCRAVDTFNDKLKDEMKKRINAQRKSVNDFMKLLAYQDFLPEDQRTTEPRAPGASASSVAGGSAEHGPPTSEADEPSQKWKRIEVGPSGQLYCTEDTESDSDKSSD